MNSTHRFRDNAQMLWQFRNHYLVNCPRCDKRASVQRLDWGEQVSQVANVTCIHCGYGRKQQFHLDGWQGATETHWIVSCGACKKALPRQYRRKHKPHEALTPIMCRHCGAESQPKLIKKESPSGYLSGAHDPYFGLPLWLQTTCCGETLWAYNAEHLAFLQGYIGATLREKLSNHNSSLASRLPAWMKRAQNRDAVLRCIEHLQNSLK